MVPAGPCDHAGVMTETPTSAAPYGPRVTREQMRDVSSLRRSSDNPMVAGVAQGLARHFDVDPLLIRVVFAALTVFGGAGLVLYLLAWVTIPRDDEHDSILSRPLRRDPERVMTAGLAIAGVIAAATMIGALSFGAPNLIPVLVVSVVAIAIFALFSRRPDRSSGPAPAAVPRSGSRTGDDPAADTEVLADSRTDILNEPATDILPLDAGDSGGATGYLPPTPSEPPAPQGPRTPRSHLFTITMAVIAIAIGALWVYDANGHSVTPSLYPGTALGIIAAGLIVGAWWGRSRLLIFAGLLATLAIIATTVVGPGPNGERIYRPTSTADLSSSYQHGAGRIAVHLEDLVDPKNLDGRTIHIKSGVGEVDVTVPSSIDVAINAHVSHGDISGLRGTADLGEGELRVTAPPGSHDVTVDIDLSLGQIDVHRVDCPGRVLAADNQITSTTGGTDVPAACN
jgi:phage shock protein PspC (stress-responsive transcriptional regulator)